MTAYINRIACAVPDHDIHEAFKRFAATVLANNHDRTLFERMAARAQIDKRWSCLTAAPLGSNDCIDAEGFYRIDQFPTTAVRMRRYELEAPDLAERAVLRLNLGPRSHAITHLLVTSCTGFYAPGLDLDIIQRCGLNTSVERTNVGFMGCNAAMNALKLAHHIVRSEPESQVLLVSLELCSLHLQQNSNLEQMLAFLLFGDGCAAALVTAEPTGLALERFETVLVAQARDDIAWRIRDSGFDMLLSGAVPGRIAEALRADSNRTFRETEVESIEMWAVHPGGRSVLDAVESALDLDESALSVSRKILRDYGNMSSATVLFVLEALMRDCWRPSARGCAMAFGPGLSAETMMFRQAA
jgi:alpha-pyrone synthase